MGNPVEAEDAEEVGAQARVALNVPNVDDVVSTYMTLKRKKEALANSIEDQIKTIDTQMGKIEAWIKEQADVQGVTSFKTKHGTAFLSTTDFASVGDWDAVLTFIKEHEAFDMLNKAVNKTAVREYIEEHKAVPPGVNYGTKVGVSIRKPTTKVD